MEESREVVIELVFQFGREERIGPYFFNEAKSLLENSGFVGGPQFFQKREEKVFIQAEIVPLEEAK